MSPLILFAVFSGGLGWSVHKKKWGLVVFLATMILWLMINQIAIAISMRPVAF